MRTQSLKARLERDAIAELLAGGGRHVAVQRVQKAEVERVEPEFFG